MEKQAMMEEVKSQNGGFSTFAGVFTPSILTILGVIMFMRTGFVIGQAGILQALIILLIAKSITILTTFSMSAIATNTEVKGGGAYYLISRTLGPEFGGTIGLALFAAQSLSIPFYIIGFTEALTNTLVFFKPFYHYITFSMAGLLFFVAFRGAGGAIKVQYVIMGILGLSIVAFLGGSAIGFDKALLIKNLNSGYTDASINFWVIFAIFFPAVTGIMAGVNMSGDLKDPAKSIPLGTFLAVGVGLIIYGAQIVLVGGSTVREALIADPYGSLMKNSIFGMGFLVALGVFAATLSSALGSYVGAPRILQSLAFDRILAPLKIFSKVSSNGEPHRALYLSTIITAGTLYWAMQSGEGALNIVASVVSMFFLFAYGIINLAAFVESFGQNPSFRPRFRFFHWSLALAGAVGCIGAAFLIDFKAAAGAIVLIVCVFMYVRKFVMKTSFGDARRGFLYSVIRKNLIQLQGSPMHAKNWRPTIITFADGGSSKLTLAKFSDWLGGGRGIVILADLIIGQFNKSVQERIEKEDKLKEFIKNNYLEAFPQVLVTPDMDFGVNQLLQSVSIGPLRPNLAVFGWSRSQEREKYLNLHMKTARALDMSVVLLNDKGMPNLDKRIKKRIDIWWRGQHNGSLMAILAYLMTTYREWDNTSIRFLRAVTSPEQKKEALTELGTLVEAARLDAEINVVDLRGSFKETLTDHSADASVVFMGFEVPKAEDMENFYSNFNSLFEELPTTLLINSTGEADLLA